MNKYFWVSTDDLPSDLKDREITGDIFVKAIEWLEFSKNAQFVQFYDSINGTGTGIVRGKKFFIMRSWK